MNTDVLDLALYAAWRARAISCIEMRILDTVNHAAQGTVVTLSNAELAARIGVAVRTLTRHVERLVDRGYLLVQQRAGKPSDWGVEQDPARWGRPAEPRSYGSTPVIRDYSHTDPPRSSATMDPGDYGHFDPPPNSASQRPERAPSRAAASSSSVACVFNPDQVFDDPHEEEAARELVMRLKLTHRQARIGVRANRDGVDVDGWLDWLARVQEPEPMKILVARIKAGEPVPEIHRAPPAAPKPAMVPMPSEAERLAIRQKYSKQARQARQQARL